MRASYLIPLAGMAGVLLLLREAAPDAWIVPLPARIAVLAILVLALVQVWRASRRGKAQRWVAACLGVLAIALALRFVRPHADAEAWRTHEETRIRARFAAVHEALLEIERAARDLGRDAHARLPDSLAIAPVSAEARAQLFTELGRLTGERGVRGGVGGAGLQLFDSRANLLAWAGTPHGADMGTRLTRLAGGTQPVYFRRSGVYTLLSFEERAEDAAARHPGALPDSARGVADSLRAIREPGNLRVLVDVPIEVRYQISNRFLRSRSLAEELSGDGIEVELTYDALVIPAYLTQADLEVHGDEERGMQAFGLLRDSAGTPLALCRLNGLAYRDALEVAQTRLDAGTRWLLVLAVALGWIAVGTAIGRHAGRLNRFARSPLLPILAIWSLRLLLAFLGLPGTHLGGSLLNPASFAMVGFGGMLRSPLDLLLTALALAATALILFVHAVRRARRTPEAGVPRWREAVGVALAAAAVALGVWLAFSFVGRVVADANPHLVGSQLDLLSPAVACLELGLLLGIGAWLVLAMLAVDFVRGPRHIAIATAVAATLVGIVLLRQTTWVTALTGVAVLVCGMRLRRLLQDDRFTSFGLATFVLAALAATLNSDSIHREYFRGNQARVSEAATGILGPSDDLRHFVLDEVLQKARAHPGLRAGLRSERPSERSALAFELWAESMLSHLGYSCEVRVYGPYGQLVSEFAVDMPPGPETSARELLERAREASAAVTQVDAGGPVADGTVHSYSGATEVSDTASGVALGAVVVSLPFAQSSLDIAANPRARTPEVLRNLQEEGIGPRVDESERLLLAWIDGGFVVESSTPYLEVGAAPPVTRPGVWQRLRLLNGDYNATLSEAGGRTLLAGFRLASPLDRILEWTQIGSFSFAVTLLALLAFLVVARGVGAAVRRLPPLLVPKRLGFQQKLMVAFLVVSLLPSVVLSIATRDIMRDRSVSRNRDAAIAKARAAEAALADLVRRDLDAVRESEYLRAVLTAAEAPPARDIGHLEFSQIMVFRGDGQLILDETLSNLSDEQARAFVRHGQRQVFASRDGKYLCLGALEKIWFSKTEGLVETAADAEPYYVYYRRRLTDRLLRNLAGILSTDISGFLGPQLVVSSQKSLATAGLLPSLVPPQAFTHVQLRDNRYVVVEETAGEQRYFAGYLPLEDAEGTRIGSLAVSQLLQPDEFAVEVERTRDLVLGLSTLMFVLTLVLGVFFAGRIFDPVRNLIEGTRRIAGGDLGFRLRARSADEIGELERSFNAMSTSLQTARWALEERRRYLEAVLGNIGSGVIATDASGRITAANPAAYRILRQLPGSLEGQSWSELAESGAGAMPNFWRRLGEAPGGEVVEIAVHGPHDLGRSAAGDESGRAADPGTADPGTLERLTLRVLVTDLLPEAGGASERLGRVAIFEDVSELIRSKKLSAWAEMARQVAHEIKNPLTPMKLSAQFMQQAFQDRSDKFPQIFQEGMTTIIQQVESLRRIASEFSNFGRVQKLQPQPMDLGKLLRGVTAPYGKIEGLELEMLDGDGRPPGDGILVFGDVEGLHKVFRNVFENAREAMGGRGRITLRVVRPGPDRVQVRISDEGPGISNEAASRLFEPYFSTKTTGTGLGLAISRGIVEELGGSIVLANRPDGGAEVSITLVVC